MHKKNNKNKIAAIFSFLLSFSLLISFSLNQEAKASRGRANTAIALGGAALGLSALNTISNFRRNRRENNYYYGSRRQRPVYYYEEPVYYNTAPAYGYATNSYYPTSTSRVCDCYCNQ